MSSSITPKEFLIFLSIILDGNILQISKNLNVININITVKTEFI